MSESYYLVLSPNEPFRFAESEYYQEIVMKKWRFILLLVVLAGVFLGVTSCKKSAEETAADEEVIKVGEYASLTGSEAAFGQSSHKGTLLAIDDINAAGGVLGKPIKLIY